jgi:hypothetical protein
MSKLNPKNQVAVVREVALSENGNLQFVKGPTHVLFETVVATLYGKDGFYEGSDERVDRMKIALKQLISQNGIKGSEFAGRVALFARNDMHIRTMPIIMVVELTAALREAKLNDPGMRKLVSDVIQRADQITDLYSYALTVFGDKKFIPLAIKKGVADSFNKFDAYQFGKYNRAGAVKFRDLLRVTHPTPDSETRQVIFNKIMTETLEAPYTWEVELSANGQKPEAERKSPKDLWETLLARKGSGEVGYMALLRNLRNICQAGVDREVMNDVLGRIADPKQVARSKQLPWAFIAAYDAAKLAALPHYVLTAISRAADASIGNMPPIGERPWIIMDVSGSMLNFAYHHLQGGKLDRSHENTSPAKVAAIFGAALVKSAQNSDKFKFTVFSNSAKHIDGLNPTDSIISIYEKIMSNVSGGGTNVEAALNLKSTLGFDPDAVVVLSDMEVNRVSGYYKQKLVVSPNFAKMFDKNAALIAVNIDSGGSTPLDSRDGWIQLAGFSPKIFEFVDFYRRADSIVQKLITGELPTIKAEKITSDDEV